jgi:hypothetical protein
VCSYLPEPEIQLPYKSDWVSASQKLGNPGWFIDELRCAGVVKTSFNSLQYLMACVKNMKNTKFVVKVNRGGIRATEYVQRIDLTPIQMTPNRKLALVMGRFTAEDAVKSLQNSRCNPELVSVHVLSQEVVAPR